jgi:hypothetical protein
MTRKTIKDWLDDPALTHAERSLIDAVRAGEPCFLQDDPETVPEADDNPAHTIRADLLALLIKGGTENCGLSPFGVALIEQLSVPKDGAEPEKFDSEYARPFSVQFVALMKRALNEYWRNPG